MEPIPPGRPLTVSAAANEGAAMSKIDVHLPALQVYVSKNGQLADDVRGVATGKLAGLRSLPADLFGDLGQESGLHGHLGSQIGELHDHVHATAEAMHGLGRSVHDAHNDYVQNDQDHQDIFTRLNEQR